ncbi:CBS domain-containing protein [Sphingomonas guangdongensis]|uniref:CBS domain-containing protein n=1 Tax=Sphingomonas guangdongensis TaxID=1141890 RepID=A0A285R3A3_9SPHN|nr:CBS domain-containing protein [Sphingomonas guangdongensis]SOB88354.1 CBS domain-containing protein [Sphingomonas guangdongensis]
MTIAVILQAKGDSVATLPASARVRDAVALLAERRIGAAPVIDGEQVVGVFSERDVIGCLAREGAAALDAPVTSAMSTPVVTVRRDEPAIGALSLMTRRRIRHLPVVEEGALVGIVSIGDLVKHRIERIEAEAAAMRDYIQHG